MRELLDPRLPTPDAALMLHHARVESTAVDDAPDANRDRLLRREEVLHVLEVSRMRRRRLLSRYV
jgi:hypothetical protein